MKIDSAFLRSRVARRLFLLFLLCALLPIGLLGALSLREVSAQLREQQEDRLEELSRAHAMTVYERINLLHSQLRRAIETESPGVRSLPDGFVGSAIGSPRGVTLDGRSLSWPHLPDPRPELQRDAPVLVTANADGQAKLLLGVAISEEEVVWGSIDPTYLWWGPSREKTLALSQELHVFGADFLPVYGTTSSAIPIPAELRPEDGTDRAPNRGVLEWTDEDESYLAGMTRLPPYYGGLAVVISEPLSELLAPLVTFRAQFLLVLLAALLAVLLASVSQIRRSLGPLEQLQQGTRRIARREFDTPVSIRSGDEFEELATSFNSMSSTLARQFAALTTMSEIGQSVLSKLASESVVTSALDRVGEVLPADAVAVSLLEPRPPDEGLSDGDGALASTWFRLVGPGVKPVRIDQRIEPRELARLYVMDRTTTIDRRATRAAWLSPFESVGSVLHLLPLRIGDELCGVMTLGTGSAGQLTDEDLSRARQLADQIAVALSNARLVSNLEQLSYGTLSALARAVDTKSPWTRGHSERVATSGRLLGQALGMEEEEQDLLYRGGMLHDIGKIGVPTAILDKPGDLTPEERELMQSHVEKGARILEPIPGFDEVLPIVWEHHERLDGRGYPRGLRGEEISLHGRIFAVVDVFDAIRSRRPYRGAVEYGDVLDLIRRGVGTEFDAVVVEAFLEVADEVNRHCWETEPSTPIPR